MANKGTILVLSCHTDSLFWFRIDMMKHFISKGYNVVAVGDEDEKSWVSRFADFGIKYRKLQVERTGTNPIKDIKLIGEIKKIILEENPSKIFCYQAKTVIYGTIAAHSAGIDEVYPLVAGLGSAFRGDGVKTSVLRFILTAEYKIALKHAKAVMFQNPDDMGVFVERKIVKPSKCEIINGSGVDISRFTPTPLPDDFAFLMISRLIGDKGVREYLNAARIIKQKYPSVRCMLVGPFDTNPSAISEEELDAYIDDGSVEYFGKQNDVVPYINQCSVFVLPSYHEGTPKTVLEAMASGRAVITTDAPGCRETVTNDENGILVPVKDVDALVFAMEAMIKSPEKCKEMGIKGRKLTEEKYDVNLINREICRIMNIE